MNSPRAILLLFVACGAACSPDNAPPPAAGADSTPATAPPFNDATLPADSPRIQAPSGTGTPLLRPPTRRLALSIEGSVEMVDARLFRAPDTRPLAFSTYFPPDMTANALASGDGYSVKFTANFGGVTTELAYLQVFLYPAGTSERMARDYIDGFLASRNPAIDHSRRIDAFPWATEAFAFRYPNPDGAGNITGSVALGQRNGHAFHILSQYPAEFGDGMAPRIGMILAQWRWLDDGSPLAGR